MKFVTFFIFIVIAVSSFGQDTTLVCSHFKKGRFIMTGPSGGEIKIKRKKKIQTERYNREHQKYRFKVEWVSNCEYILTLKKAHGKKSVKEYVGSKVYVTIIHSRDDYYTALSRTEKGETTKIEITKIR